jgi:hypothetical protein
VLILFVLLWLEFFFLPFGLVNKSPSAQRMMEGKMIAAFADPFDALFNLQRALEGRLASDWRSGQPTYSLALSNARY